MSVAVIVRAVPGPWQRGAEATGDLLGMAALVLCLPFVILAAASPLVLCASVVVWIIGKL